MKLILPLIILLAVANFSMTQRKYESVIKGRVVDDSGQPVENANIRLDVPEDLYKHFCGAKDYSVLPDLKGYFMHEEHCGVSKRTVTLFIVPSLQNVIVPIRAPFWQKLRLSDPKFAGLKVELEENKPVELGDVPIQVQYQEVELYVLDKNGNPYYKTEDDWHRFQLLIRNSQGDDVGSAALSIDDVENKVDIKKGFIKAALPEGVWVLELLKSLDDYDNETGKTSSYLIKTIVKIDNRQTTERIFLTISKSLGIVK